MKKIKKYIALKINTKTVDDNVEVDLVYGSISGPYYDRTEPDKEFDTEEEAEEYAYKMDKYSDWLVLPKISFDNFE